MTIRVLTGDCRDVLPTLAANSVHTIVTSPPYYGLRDYGTAQWQGGDPQCEHTIARNDTRLMRDGAGNTNKSCTSWTHRDATPPRQCSCGAKRIDSQIGLEATPDEYIQTMVEVFRELKRVLRDDGTCWVNMGDSYNANQGNGFVTAHDTAGGARKAAAASPKVYSGLASKQLLMMPARLALALQADGWWIRSQIVWHKPGPMPESVRDRPTSAHEMVYLLAKSPKYYFDMDSIREPSGAAPRNVWTIASYPFSEWAETSRRVRVEWDAPDDGKKRKASPDCPVHADRPDPAPNGRGDGRASGLRVHTSRSDTRHDPELTDGSAPTVRRLERSIVGESSGLPLLECAGVAIPHSIQSHRTDLALVTNPACSASAQMADDTECILAGPWPSGSAGHTTESNSEQGASDDSPSSQTASRIAHIPDEQALSSASDPSRCTCEWYVEKTEKTSHFATFPPALAERCIKAGTSERGCCAQCGMPWTRTTNTSYQRNRTGHSGRTDDTGSNGWDGGDYPNLSKVVTTTGWAPACQCNAATVPCVVLDPFAGAGTTGLVADRLQRDAVMIELNESYCTMLRNRIESEAPLFTTFSSYPPAEDPEDERMRDLFAEAAE